MAGDAQTPPSRPPHCEDPPVPPSVRGSPLTDGGTGGRPPGDGICQSRRWPVSGQDAGPGRQRAGSPTRSLPRGNGPHPGHIRPASQSPWGPVRGTGSSARHPEVRSFSRGPHLPARLPPRQRQSAREELGTWGREEGPATVPRQLERSRRAGGRDPRPRTGPPVGSLARAPPGRLRALLRLQRPHPATRRQTWTRPLQPSSLCRTTQKWSVTAATSVPQSSNPDLCEGIGGLLSLASAKGIHLR